MMSPSAILTEQQVSDWILVPVPTLRGWRRRGVGPGYLRIGDRTIRYEQATVAAWLAARKVA